VDLGLHGVLIALHLFEAQPQHYYVRVVRVEQTFDLAF
jgi:hypothetical protein